MMNILRLSHGVRRGGRRQSAMAVAWYACVVHFSTATATAAAAYQAAAAAATTRRRIGVIGGGASGIFASIQAAANNPNVEVVVFEGGPKTLGKVKISGGGRCNVLHDTTKPVNSILASYPRGAKELRGLYAKHFTPAQAREWFTSRGVTLKTEADGRMFPTTDSSQTIIDTLLEAAEDAGVNIRRKEKVDSIVVSSTQDNGQASQLFAVSLKDESVEHFDAIILATGSSKVGHEFATNLGHQLVDPVPSLFTLNTKLMVKEEGLLHELSGVSVPTARLTFKLAVEGKKKKQVLQQEGPLLITHHGISGPATLRLSAFGARQFHQIQYRGDIVVHWAPTLGTTQEVADLLWQIKTISPKRAVSTSCPLMVSSLSSSSSSSNETNDSSSSAIPRRLWASMVRASGFEKETTWNEAPKKKVNALARMMAECVLDVTGKSVYKDEFVTAGGVSLKEIDMKTMASKKCSGLFLCGEVINVDGVTGGFNFMNCWSTGYTAGNGAVDFVSSNMAADISSISTTSTTAATKS